jgi:N-terminal domain of anti-restriction factor ArdC
MPRFNAEKPKARTKESKATMNNTAKSNVATLPSSAKAQTAKDVIAANVKLLIEQLEAGHSEGLTAYLTAMGRFHNYSFGNILEIARQRPSATRVAGMYAWNQLGRRINKGEKGIRKRAAYIRRTIEKARRWVQR